MAKGNAKSETVPAAGGLPLFFKSPAAINSERHAKAAVQPSLNVHFAVNTNSVMVNAVEFVEAAKHYPIVFSMDEGVMPTVVLGLEQNNNFIDKNDHWVDGAYIPAYVRRYPFVFTSVPDSDNLVLCIDEAAPQYRKEGGKGTMALYDGENPSEYTKNALEFCKAFQQQFEMTRLVCKAFHDAGLLTPARSDVKLADGRSIRLGGFQVLDEKKLAALPEATVLEWHKKGWMALAYFVLLSSSNWQKLADKANTKH